jgi:nitronate monooxygenase
VGNAFTKLVGIDVPIVQAAMGGASSPALAATVSNAGGLGMLALAWSSADEVRAEIRATKALTTRPFGVNLVLTQLQEERLAIALGEGVQVISFFWGDPSSNLVEAAHLGGAKVLQTVSSAQDGRRAVLGGADVIVAQGWEAGGHVYGEVTTLALVPMVVDAVGATSVIAAGGIADGRGLAAALALGAAGVWIGTRFLAAPEAAINTRYRDFLLSAGETDTEYSGLFDVNWPKAPHRTLRNSTSRAWEAAGRPPPGKRPGEGGVVGRSASGDVVRYQSHTPDITTDGDIEAMALWAGQGVGLVRKIQPAGEIVREIAQEARVILKRLSIVSL